MPGIDIMQIKTVIALASPFFLSFPAFAQKGDCITQAAQCFQVNPLLIKAIIWHESRNQPQALNINKNKTVDVGIMQINTVHFNSLKRRGIDEQRLRKDSCANVFSGTWILKQKIERYGYTWDGIGSYYSRTAIHREKYVRNIVSLIAHQTATLDKIAVPPSQSVPTLFSCK